MLVYDFDAMRDYEDMKMGRGGYGRLQRLRGG